MRRISNWCVLFVSIGWLNARAADGPADARLFTASELPRLAQGVELDGSGTYTLKVWAPGREQWAGTVDGTSVTLKMTTEGDAQTPRWRTVGTVQVEDGQSVRVIVDGLGQADGESDESEAVAVPALLVLTKGPDFEPTRALEVVRGRLNDAAPVPDPRRETVRTNRQGADFRAPASARAWNDRAKTLREQLLVSMGLWPMPPRTPLHPRVLGKVERAGYTIERVLLETMPGVYLGGNLYKPIGKTGPLPGVLCPHGHWSDGRVNPEVQMRCIHLARMGFAVFMYDMVGYNDSKPFGHAFSNPRLTRWGLSLVTLQTWNSLRALDWLSSLPEVDSERIGCTGESGGGTQTFLLTAIDPRVKVAAPIVMVSDGFQGGCVCENAAGLRHGTDNVEIAALCAPRPLKLVGATGDWTAKTMTNAYPAIRGAYELIGQPERVSAVVFDFPHNYNETSRNAVYPFLAHWLLGSNAAAPVLEGEQTPEVPEVLWALPTEDDAPSDTKTPEELETALVARGKAALRSLAPGEDGTRWQAARALLGTAHRVRVGVVNPPPFDIESAQARRVQRPGLTIVHYEIGRKSTGEHVPVVRLVPERANGRVTVIFSPHGKAHLVDSSGEPTGLVRALLERGQGVIGFDPFLVGESADPAAFRVRRPVVTHYDCYNKSVAAERMQDLATVVAWSRAQPDVTGVNLVGQGRWGVLALLARPALVGTDRTAIDLHGFAYRAEGASIPAELELPGVLQFGGLSMAAALSAPAPLWITRAPGALKASWARRAYELADASSRLRVDSERASDADLAAWLEPETTEGEP